MFYSSSNCGYLVDSGCNKYKTLTDFELRIFFVKDENDLEQIEKMQKIILNKYNEIIKTLCIKEHNVNILDIKKEEVFDYHWNVYGENLKARIIQ